MRGKFNIKGLYEAAVREGKTDRFYGDLNEALDKGEVSPEDFSVRQLFEQFVDDGGSIISQWFHNPENRMSIMEAGVNTTAFSNITGQLLVNKTMDAYNGPAFIGDQLCSTIPTKLPKGEKIPGMSAIGNEAEAVGEAQPYPFVGFGEDWVETPETIKRGMIVPLTREVIVADLTGLLFQRAEAVGEWMGYNKELRVLGVALGTSANVYNRRGRGTVATYGDTSGYHDWDNQVTDNLVDWTDLENALLAFDAMTDPNTGEPINVVGGGKLQLVVPTAKLFTAKRVISATEIRYGDGAGPTTQTLSANPVGGMFDIVSSQLVYKTTSSNIIWYVGNFKKAFAYMQVSPLQVVKAPTNNHDEFHRDIVDQWKVSEWGVAAALDPRYVVKSTGAA